MSDRPDNADDHRQGGAPPSGEPCPHTIRAWTMLLRSQQVMLDKVEDRLKQAGLPPLGWYDVLLELDRAPDGWLRQADIGERVLIAQYNLSRLADRLVRDGLVERRQCPVDGRNNVLEITPDGRALRARMWPVYAAAIAENVSQRLTSDEAHTLSALLAKLAAPPA